MKKGKYKIIPDAPVLVITEEKIKKAETSIAQHRKEGKEIFPDYDRSVDETLLRMIEQDGLSDKEFFEYITESPRYLQYEPFQKKILRWQATLFFDYYTESEKYKAKENLKKIGDCLSYEGSGRKKNSRQETGIFYEYLYLIRILPPIVERMSEIRNPAARNLLFQKMCPGYSPFVTSQNKKWTTNELARRILSKKYIKSPRTVDRIIAENIDIQNRTMPYSRKSQQ